MSSIKKAFVLEDNTVFNKGHYWLIKAADKGIKEAQKELADSYLFGLNGIEKNSVKADYWLKEYEKDSTEKMVPSEKVNIKKAETIKKEEPKAETPPARNLSETTVQLLKAADRGVKESEFIIGEKYANGDEFEKNPYLAFDYYLKSANSGYDQAMVAVGLCYKTGQGVDKDEEIAFDWFTKAADLGFIPAFFQVGVCLLEGVGAVQNKKFGLEYLTRAMDQGYVRANTYLADEYIDGRLVRKDSIKARELFEQAAAKEDPYALYKLGEMYAGNGLSVEKNERKAAQYFAKAATLGQPDAEYMLGYYYTLGLGGRKQDMDKAYTLLKRAASKGNRLAISELKKLYDEEVEQ